MKPLFLFLLLSSSLISQISKDTLMLLEINKIRENPKSIIPDIEKRIESSENKIKRIRNGKILGDTATAIERHSKNIEAAKELIVELKNSMKRLKPLKIDTGINKVARYHCEYLDNSNLYELLKSGNSVPLDKFHTSYNGEKLSDRFKKFNYNNYNPSENVAVFEKDIKEILIDLLIDNGIEDRGHRKNLLNPNVTHIGIHIGKKFCVQNFIKK